MLQQLLLLTQLVNTLLLLKTLTILYAGTFADSLILWVNSDDLYYGSCVVENGLPITAPYSNPTAWHYEISSQQTAYGCYATSTDRYAPMAYAEYVDIFYLNSTLSSPANGSII